LKIDLGKREKKADFLPVTHVWRKVFLKMAKLTGSVRINACSCNGLRVPNDVGTPLGHGWDSLGRETIEILLKAMFAGI
jgi:hypothetical protein